MSHTIKELKDAIVARGGSVVGATDKEELQKRLASLVIRSAPAEKKVEPRTARAADMAGGYSTFEGVAAVFWDIENMPIPKGCDTYLVVAAVRSAVVGKIAWKGFEAFGDVKKLSSPVEKALHECGVKLTHVAADSKNKADFMIIRGIQEFGFGLAASGDSGLVVLISSDINFAPTLQGLRALSNVRTVVIHGPSSRSLRDSCDEAILWSQIISQAQAGKKPDGKSEPKEKPDAKSDPGKQKTDSGDEQWECKECGSQFATLDSVKQHQASLGHRGCRKAQPQRQSSVKKDDAWECKECGSEFASVESVKQHQASLGHRGYRKVQARDEEEDDDDAWECKECGSQFATLDSVKQHQASLGHRGYRKVQAEGHRASRPEQWECKECGSKFAAIESVKQHLATLNHRGYNKSTR